MTDSGDYQQAWQQYKRQGRLWIALFILYVPAVVARPAQPLSFCILRDLRSPWPLIWMAFTLYLGARINLWRCRAAETHSRGHCGAAREFLQASASTAA